MAAMISIRWSAARKRSRSCPGLQLVPVGAWLRVNGVLGTRVVKSERFRLKNSTCGLRSHDGFIGLVLVLQRGAAAVDQRPYAEPDRRRDHGRCHRPG